MQSVAPGWSRRKFLSKAGMMPVVGASLGGAALPPGASAVSSGFYERLGVRPFINAAGTYTALSGSSMPPEVSAAMAEASRQHVSIPELQQAAGRRIASLVGAEACLVTAGCAAALTAATAACVCGDDGDAIRRVPDTTGLKNRVIVQKAHRLSYDHAIRNVGVTLHEVESREELVAAIDERTAMLFFLNHADSDGQIQRQEFADIGRERGIPTLIDAAADLPPASNLTAFTAMGYDLVAFSGGKGLRGPQCSGLLLGRAELIRHAFLNGSPHSDSVARTAKVGKEEIAGLTRAVELYLERDHDAEWREWESRVEAVLQAVEGIPGVEGERFVPEIANAVPHAAIVWDPARHPFSRDDFAQALREGDPRIEARPSDPEESRLEIGVWMMAPGEHLVVAERCARFLKG